ncbi:MAG TPA: extracellular solute-binding protein [Rhodanobacteraceae bacterium]
MNERHDRHPGRVALAIACALVLAVLVAPDAMAAPARHDPKILTVYAAGTLAVPFKRIDAVFEKLHPGVTVEPQFGGSVMMARRISDLHQHADVFASADYTVIPAILGKAHLAPWFVGFASNAVTLAYTPKSHGAAQVNSNNWYRVVAEPGVVIGRSDPNTDPSGYQFLQMLSLASRYYHAPDLEQRVLKNAPRNAMRDTETSLVSALQLGQIDYLAIYTSSAIDHHLEYVKLPADINLGDPAKYASYARGTARTRAGVLSGKPVIYAATVPTSADHPKLAVAYVRFLLGKQGQSMLAASGLTPLPHAPAHGGAAVPAAVRSIAGAWPVGLTLGR